MGSPARVACLVIVGALLVPREARADVELLGGHVAYGLGGAFAPESVGSGLRQGLDVFVGFGERSTRGSSAHMWSSHSGWILGPSLYTGFGAYPTYGAFEWLSCEDTTIAGIALGGGPAMRITPEPAGGLTLRVSGDLLAIQLGVRALALFGPGPEFALTGTLGLGRF